MPAELVVDASSSGGGTNSLLATFEGFSDPIVGLAVSGSVAVPSVGVTSVTPGSGISTQAAATIVGIITNADTGGGVRVQYSGIVTLTEDEWAAVVSGGLTASEAYFVDTAGHLTDVAPGTPGNWSSQVFVALNSTQVLLCTPSVPVLVS